nr:ABC transporter permease subunit [Halobacterium noricense]
MGSPGGYVSLTYDLLLPVEVLIPTLAFAYVYRSIRGDDERGELDVIRTYDVSRLEYVAGVFIGRTAVLLVVVLTTLGVAGVVASLGATPAVEFFATHQAGDTPVVYLRFMMFAAVYTLVASGIALTVSAATRTNREAIAASVGMLLALAIALDLVVVTLVSTNIIDAGSIAVFTGLSPASAFRGLVLEMAIQPALAVSPSVATASPLTSAVSLLSWLGMSIGIATVATWTETT